MTDGWNRQAARQDNSRLRLRGPYTPDGRERSDRRYRPLFWVQPTDWAGRAILNRYLTGGGNWTIQNDPQWRAYMMDNGLLRQQLLQRITALSRRLIALRAGNHDFDETFNAEVENGEDINGYQYLHGTNMHVGGFRLRGRAFVIRNHNNRIGEHLVNITAHYQWNDVIDHNSRYFTDTVKNAIAEAITLGVAEPYNISINWTALCLVIISPGKPDDVRGYPGVKPWSAFP
jgi:hypothetical protein